MRFSLFLLLQLAAMCLPMLEIQVSCLLITLGLLWLQRKHWPLQTYLFCLILLVPLLLNLAARPSPRTAEQLVPDVAKLTPFLTLAEHLPASFEEDCLQLLDAPTQTLANPLATPLFDEIELPEFASMSLVSLNMEAITWKGTYFSGEFRSIEPSAPRLKLADGRLFYVYLKPLPSPGAARGYLALELMLFSEHPADRKGSWLVSTQPSFLHAKPIVVEPGDSNLMVLIAEKLQIHQVPFEVLLVPELPTGRWMDRGLVLWILTFLLACLLACHELGKQRQFILALPCLLILLIPYTETRDYLSVFASYLFGTSNWGGLLESPFRFLVTMVMLFLLIQSLAARFLRGNQAWGLIVFPLTLTAALVGPLFFQRWSAISLVHPMEALKTPGGSLILLGLLFFFLGLILVLETAPKVSRLWQAWMIGLCCAIVFQMFPEHMLAGVSFSLLWIFKESKPTLSFRGALAVLCFFPLLFLQEQAKELDYVKNELLDEITLMGERNYFRMGRIIQRLGLLEEDLRSHPHENILELFARKCGLLENEVDFALSLVGPDNQVVSTINHHLAFDRLPVISFPLDRIDSIRSENESAEWMVFRTALDSPIGDYDFTAVLGNDYQSLSLVRGPRNLLGDSAYLETSIPYFAYIFEVFEPNGRRLYSQGASDTIPIGANHLKRLEKQNVYWETENNNTVFYIKDHDVIYRITHKATPITMTFARFLALWLALSILLGSVRLLQRPGRNLLSLWRRSFALKLATFMFLASGVPMTTLGYILINSIQTNQSREELSFAQSRMLAATNLFRGIDEDQVLGDSKKMRVSYRNLPLPLFARILGEDLSLYVDGNLVNTNQPEMYRAGVMNRRLSMELTRSLLVEKTPFVMERASNAKNAPNVAYASVPLGRGREGVLAMTIIPFSQRQKQRLFEQLEFSLSVLFGLVFLMALFSRYLSQSFLQPVSAITRSASRMAKGHSNQPILINRQDELERMVAAFNMMQERVLGSQNQLRQQLGLLDATLSSMSSGVLGFSQDGQILLENAIAWKLLHLEVPVVNIHGLVDQDAQLAPIHRMFEEGRNGELNLHLQKDSDVRHILAKIRFVKVMRKLDVYCIVAFEDITNAMAASRFKAWSEMARRIAHEIKNPLTPIQLEVDHLNRLYQDNHPNFGEALSDATEEIRTQVTHLKRIATEFSDYARPLELKHEPTNLGHLLESLIEPYERTIDTLEIVRQIEPAVCAEVDARLLRRALHNLIVNAIQAMEKEGVLTIFLEKTADQAVIWVQDNGPGIALAEQAQVFEAYFSTKDQGSGLGLVIARKYLTSHGGELFIDPNYTSGTRFIAKVPLTAKAADDLPFEET